MSLPSTSSSINVKDNSILLKEILIKLNVNKINEKDIKLTKSIAKGGQGKIKYGIFKNLEVIIKILPKESMILIIQEIINMIKYKSANIPKFIGVFETEKSCGLVMEFIEGLNLTKIISLEKQGKINLSLIQKFNYLIQLSSVIDYLNSNNLIHRDLKTDNILIDKLGQLKLIDFGISLQGKKLWIKVDSPYYSLTPNYMAPEIVYQNEESNDVTIIKENGKYKVLKNNLKDREKDIENELSEKINIDEMNNKWILISDKYDVWTFGIIMCQLFTRCKPWCRNEQENLSEIEVQSRIVGRLPYPINEFYPIDECKNYKNEIKNIITQCLNFEPEERPPIKKVKEDLLKLYSKIFNEKSIIEHYNQMRIIRIKNYEKNKNVLKINKQENDGKSDEQMIFENFRVNRRNMYINENNNKNIGINSLNNPISLFNDKILKQIIEDNIKLRQNILIKKSIMQNDFNINNNIRK